jgi:cold-inducible RNA-binding protein
VNIYVGNISFSTTEEDLRQAFEAYGPVTSATILKDKLTNRSRGFGFVEMPDAANGAAAIAGLNGQQLGGRELNVSEARPRTEGNDRDRGRSFGGNRDRRDNTRLF